MDASSDLIVDVARAADPKRSAAMAQRLAALNGSGDVDPAAFADALSSAKSVGFEPTVNARAALPQPAQAQAGPAGKARQQFEASMLNSFISEMMPKDTSSAYGGGYAGDMWRSLLSEKVADTIAKSGRLGIASRLFDGGHSPALTKLEHASQSTSAENAVTVTSSNELSLPVGGASAAGAYLFQRKSI
jgi:peptidoglycan hydrolase FlgJ